MLLTILPKCLTILQGFAIPKETQDKVAKFSFHGEPAELKHGSVVIAAITSCTNTSNPSVMLGAGLVAKKACELGLQVSHHHVLLFTGRNCLLIFFPPHSSQFGTQLLLAFLLLRM